MSNKIKNPFLLKLFFLKNLPTAWFWGIRCKDFDENQALVTLKHSWFSKNPYQSTYFAALAGAGEFSTGILAMAAIKDRSEKISMLVLNMEANFTKKAVGTTTFTCVQGQEVKAVVQKAIDTKAPQTITMLATGANEQGEKVTEVRITWTFKARV
jgi:hypothetical protein